MFPSERKNLIVTTSSTLKSCFDDSLNRLSFLSTTTTNNNKVKVKRKRYDILLNCMNILSDVRSWFSLYKHIIVTIDLFRSWLPFVSRPCAFFNVIDSWQSVTLGFFIHNLKWEYFMVWKLYFPSFFVGMWEKFDKQQQKNEIIQSIYQVNCFSCVIWTEYWIFISVLWWKCVNMLVNSV